MPSQFSGFEKLPKEILPLIFGRLSFADLIMAKNVSRRFNIVTKQFLAKTMPETQICAKCVIDPSRTCPCGFLSHEGGIFFASKITFKIFKFGEKSYEEYIWLFLLANHKKYPAIKHVLQNIITLIFYSDFDNEMILYYFRKYGEIYDSPDYAVMLLTDQKCTEKYDEKFIGKIMKSYNQGRNYKINNPEKCGGSWIKK